MTIESNRTTGGVAACLFVTSVVSQVLSIFQNTLSKTGGVSIALVGISGIIGILGFVALILFFVAMHGFSKDYSEPRIFDYIIYGLVAAIIIGILSIVVAIAIAIANAASVVPILTSSTTSQTQISGVVQKSLLPMLPIFAAVSLVWILFNVLSINLLGDKSKVVLFRTGAKVLLAGALVSVAATAILAAIAYSLSLSYSTILLTLSVPGGLIQDVAWVILAMAFFRIQTPPAFPTAPVNMSAVPTLSSQTKICPKCGVPNQADALLCERCGQKL